MDDIVHSDEYSLLNGLYGELPRRDVADLFRPGRSNHIVHLDWWHRQDKAAAAGLDRLTRRYKKGR